MPQPMTAERAAKADVDATMSRLLAAMQTRVRSFLGNLLGHRAAIELDDITQETMARAWRSRAGLDPGRGSGESWLLRIAFRAFLDHHRRLPEVAAHDEELVAGGRGPAELVASRDHTESLLAQLPATERDVLLRFHRDGESIERIAAGLRMPTGTVKSHLHRARNRMWALEHRGGEQ